MGKESERYETEVERLALAHWSYVDGILIAHGQHSDIRATCRYHYLTAFVHGWKHAMESAAETRRIFSEHGGIGDK